MWAFGGHLIFFFALLLRRFWAKEGANGSLGGEQRPPLLKQTTSGQHDKLNFTLQNKTAVFEQFGFNTLLADGCHGFLDIASVFYMFYGLFAYV